MECTGGVRTCYPHLPDAVVEGEERCLHGTAQRRHDDDLRAELGGRGAVLLALPSGVRTVWCVGTMKYRGVACVISD